MVEVRSQELFDRAKVVIPGGVNSPVRAFGSVGMSPRFIARAKGDRIWDVDGNEYIDYIGSWGPMILGHAHPVVLEAVEQAAKDGLSFGAATGREVDDAGVPHRTNHVGSLGCVFFTPEKVRDYARAQTSDTGKYTAYFKHMLGSGIYLAPSRFEAMFLSTAHTEEDLQRTLNAVREFVK